MHVDRSRFVSPRFFNEVQRHLICNLLGLPLRPPVLGIFGQSGEGKTFQLEQSLAITGTEVIRVYASDLENKYAGEPAKLVHNAYADAGNFVRDGRATCVVLDDVDTTLGEWEENSGTVNHQQLIAELMHLSDRPVDSARGYNSRVPVFFTGNNAARLYAPLTRTRRMRLFAWAPTDVERQRIIENLFESICNEPVAELLMQAFPGEPVAFYSDLAHLAHEAAIGSHPAWFITDMNELLRNWGGRGHEILVSRPQTPDGLVSLGSQYKAERQSGYKNYVMGGE